MRIVRVTTRVLLGKHCDVLSNKFMSKIKDWIKTRVRQKG